MKYEKNEKKTKPLFLRLPNGKSDFVFFYIILNISKSPSIFRRHTVLAL